ncbi:MAG: hypothetical protein NC483_04580 [Ruminococcus sp.]|nr:hypothetical protein [Ruminococcus sp.]
MKKILVILCIICLFSSIKEVRASDDGLFAVSTEAEFDECLKSSSACKLTSDLRISESKVIEGNLMLNLNGRTLSAVDNLKVTGGLLVVKRGAKLTIYDTTGTGKITTGSSGNVYGGIQLANDNNSTEVAELVVNSGTIEGYYYGIVGNGNTPHTKVTINGGTITGLNKEDSLGIFQPQLGDLVINGGTITGGTGIEIRSGNLTINNGTIKGVAPKFIKMVNGNGSTTNGVGVAVSQHTTKNNINVNIKNGDISGEYAFYEWNPHKNNKTDIDKVKITIEGGNFVGTATGVKCVYSEDFTEFISDGKFNTDVSEYLTKDSKVVFKEVNTNKGENNYIIPLIVVGLLFILIIYVKRNIRNYK